MSTGVEAAPAAAQPTTTGIGAAWLRYWFVPADPRPLGLVRILTGILGLLLLWSYAGDLETWFGPDGMIPAGAAAWRPRFGVSLYDLTTSMAGLRWLFGITIVVFVAVTVGLGTAVVAPAAAILWASLLHRGPMLAGPADDCLAVLLWCLAVGPAGACWSLDRLIATGLGRPPAGASMRARIATALLQVHAAVIAAAGVVAQLKGDAWWDGTAAWWLAARPESRLVDVTGLFTASEYLCNLVTHAITAFEILFAALVWFTATQRGSARAGLLGWPLVGVLAGEPLWGCAMAIFCLPLAFSRPPADA